MFRAHIRVSEDTDVAAELIKIDNLAHRHNLEPIKVIALMRSVEDVLSDLKKQDAETAAYGIKLAVKKSVATADYDIVLELHPRKESNRKGGPLSWLFGR